MTYLYMGCCGGVMGHHEYDCDDLAAWRAEELAASEALLRASQREATEQREAA